MGWASGTNSVATLRQYQGKKSVMLIHKGGNTIMASQSNPYEFFSSMMKNLTVDRDALLSSHRKNIEALTEATKMASDVMRSLTQMQQQYVKQAFESMSSMVKENVNKGVNQDTFKQQAESFKNHMNQSLEHGVTVASVVSKSQKQLYEMMKDHVNQHVESFQKKAKPN